MSVHLPHGYARGPSRATAPRPAQPRPPWRQVCDDLRRRIAAGEFVPGFSGEFTLPKQYQISRHAVRDALRVLRGEGLVVSEGGHTSTIAPPRVRHKLDTVSDACSLRLPSRCWLVRHRV
ncbi:MAG: GntR family transcriptional regulator [Actinobacteria bacterium]|nr:GntR family transcriptional regulator [Actinomycetota bacterium]